MQFQGMNISPLHMYPVYLPLPELYRKCCANFIEYIWDIRNKVQQIKHLSELNKLTV